MPRQYILNGHEAVPCDDLDKWARWFGEHTQDRVLKQENVGPYFVSTVFLGLDHRYGAGPPLLWETMIFEGEEGDRHETRNMWSMWRYSTWEKAEAGHNQVVKNLRAEWEPHETH